jgi:hypothetical protein
MGPIAFSELPTQLQQHYESVKHTARCYRRTHSQFGTVYCVNETYWRRSFGAWEVY